MTDGIWIDEKHFIAGPLFFVLNKHKFFIDEHVIKELFDGNGEKWVFQDTTKKITTSISYDSSSGNFVIIPLIQDSKEIKIDYDYFLCNIPPPCLETPSENYAMCSYYIDNMDFNDLDCTRCDAGCMLDEDIDQDSSDTPPLDTPVCAVCGESVYVPIDDEFCACMNCGYIPDPCPICRGPLDMIDDERIACPTCGWNNYNFEEN